MVPGVNGTSGVSVAVNVVALYDTSAGTAAVLPAGISVKVVPERVSVSLMSLLNVAVMEPPEFSVPPEAGVTFVTWNAGVGDVVAKVSAD